MIIMSNKIFNSRLICVNTTIYDHTVMILYFIVQFQVDCCMHFMNLIELETVLHTNKLLVKMTLSAIQQFAANERNKGSKQHFKKIMYLHEKTIQNRKVHYMMSRYTD